MCKNCHETSSGSVALSLAMTNPELVWAYNQEQKRASCQASKAQQSQIQQQQSQADIMSSSASTFSGSTAYSYDKGLDKTDTKQKRSVKQRIKEAFKDLGSPPTAYHDRVNGRKTEEPTPEYGPMSSTPQSRT